MAARASIPALKAARPSVFRSLHTSRPALYSSSDLPPTPSSAEALGFKPQAHRQRQLPEDLKIIIPASGRDDIFTPKQQVAQSKRRDVTFPLRTKQTTSNPESTEDFFSNLDLASEPVSSTSAPRSRRSMNNVSTDLISGSASDSSVPPDVARRQRQNQRTDRARAPGGKARQPQTQALGRSRAGPGGRDRKPRTRGNVSPRDKKNLLPRRELTFETPEQGLFGKKSLISDTVASTVEARLGHARKYPSLRQAKSPSALPSVPLPVLSAAPSKAAQQAIQIASWTAALNGSISRFGKSQLSDTVAAQLKR